MDFELPPDTQMLRDMVRRFVEKEARPLEMKYFTTGGLEPREHARLHTAIEQMGLWGATVPEAYSGVGLDTLTACVLEEELGKTLIPIDVGEVPPFLYACRGEQVGRYLQTALAGSRKALLAAREPGGLRPEDWTTTALPDGESFLLNGDKLVARRPTREDFLIVFAKSPGGLTAFLLEPDLDGIKVSENGEISIRLETCRAGRESILGECGQALNLGAEQAPRAWIRLGARYLGLAERLVSMAAAYANDWSLFGAPLANRPAVRHMLADASVQIEGVRWLVYQAAWSADLGKALQLSAAQVRLATGEMLQRIVDMVTMIYGGPGPTPQIGPQIAQITQIVRMRPQTLELALGSAKEIIAAHVLAASKGS